MGCKKIKAILFDLNLICLIIMKVINRKKKIKKPVRLKTKKNNKTYLGYIIIKWFSIIINLAKFLDNKNKKSNLMIIILNFKIKYLNELKI